MRVVRPVLPAPGDNLKIPESLDVETFCKQIGGDCEEYYDKFESMQEIMTQESWLMRQNGVPTKQRRYILHIRELLKRGVLTWEYLSRRTCTAPVRNS